VYVADADKTARKVVEPGTKCLEILAEKLGKEILFEDGSMNRARVAEIVFSDKEKLEILNRVTHKYIQEDILSELANENAELKAIDGAVIIGSPVEKDCEFIVSVLADEDTRVKRITARDNISEEAARKRICAQPSESFYIENSRYIIRNDGTHEALEEEVKGILEKIRLEIEI
jgi:dephospho-CoA kinase